jgi:excisionase family DNA binding protein
MYVGGELESSRTPVHRKRVGRDAGGRERPFVEVAATPFAQLADDDLLDVQDLCRLFPCSRRSAYRWLAEGSLRYAHKVGREYYFTKHEVLRWWDARPLLGRPLERRR